MPGTGGSSGDNTDRNYLASVVRTPGKHVKWLPEMIDVGTAVTVRDATAATGAGRPSGGGRTLVDLQPPQEENANLHPPQEEDAG